MQGYFLSELLEQLDTVLLEDVSDTLRRALVISMISGPDLRLVSVGISLHPHRSKRFGQHCQQQTLMLA